MSSITRSILAVGLSLLSLGASAADKTQLSLMLDWFVNPNHGPIVIAKEKGYFDEANLDVDIQEPADPSVPAKMVAAGKSDLAVTYQPSLTIDVAAGLPLVRTGTLISTPLNVMLTLKSSGIDSVEKLKGKTIGISVGGNEEGTVGNMLESAGLTFDDIKIVNVGWALSSSLASGKVDAVWGAMRNFESNQLELEGQPVNEFFPEEHGVPTYDELVFVANSKTYDKTVISAFNHAIERATLYIVNHPDKAWKEFVQYSPDTLDTKLNQMAWEDTLTRFALRPQAADANAYQNFANFMYDTGLIKNKVTGEQILADF
ncbi:MAG: ABC transporter substrate-binding protein [Vibrio sp.]